MATLTTVKGVNRTLVENTPAERVPSSQHYGRLRILYDKYVVGTADEFGTSGLIRMMSIPKKAMLHDATVVMQAAGATGIFDVGWAASAELSAGSAVVAADPDGILVDIDPGAAAINARMLGTEAGYKKTFDAEVEVQVDWEEASADSGDDTLHLTLYIAVD